MEEQQEKTISDRELWKKAESINKAKFLALMGSSTRTVWILTFIAIAIVAALIILIPPPPPSIKSASQSGDKIAVLTDNWLYLADKTTKSLEKVPATVDAISVAAGKDYLAVTYRPLNKVDLYDWQGKSIGELNLESPSACCVGTDWLYVMGKNDIRVYKDQKQINSMPNPQLQVAKSIFEHEAVWVADYGKFWKSGVNGWIPVPIGDGQEDFKSAWVGDRIWALFQDHVTKYNLDGSKIENIDLPSWGTGNNWLCEDLITISGNKIILGSLKEANPYEFDLGK